MFSERRGGHLCVVRCRRRRRAALFGSACVVVVVRCSGALDRGQVEVARISYVIRMTDQPTARGASQQANQQAQQGRVSQHGTSSTTTHAGLLASGDHTLQTGPVGGACASRIRGPTADQGAWADTVMRDI